MENRIAWSRNLIESQNPTMVASPSIKKDANMSGIKKLTKNVIGVATNIVDVTHTNVKNDNRRHFNTSV